jgi:membrane-associated phospholipid phosphatase
MDREAVSPQATDLPPSATRLRECRCFEPSAVAPAAVLALETACFVASAALVGRPRPEGVWRPEPPHATSSFPSGHTAAAFALHGTLADLLDRHGAHAMLGRWSAAVVRRELM